jgi:hypothetical protein
MRHLKFWSVASVTVLSMLALAGCDDLKVFGMFGPNPTAPTITAPASPLTAGSTGTAYPSTTFTASGTSPITWSVTAGALPPGMTLSAAGVYSGTPTAGGTFSFTVTATNSVGSDADPYTHTIMGGAVDSNVLLTNNSLAAFAAATPGGIEAGVTVTGLNAGDVLVSIDRRPQNGFLYALGYNAGAGTVQLYSLSSTTAVATPIGTTGSFVAADGTTPAPVGMGTSTVFGIDFNPTVDRVRVVNSAGQNFRMNPNNGAFVDGNAMAANLQMDGAINGPTTGVQETAYTNNNANVTLTTQYTLDATTDALCIQNPPNNGTQTQCQALSSLVDNVLGFDIPPGVDTATANAPVAAGNGFAVLQLTGQTGTVLSNLDLTNGALGTPAAIPATGIVGLAVLQPLSTSMVALSADGTQLIRFLSASPGTATTVAITGVTAGETLVGLDYRAQTGQLFSFGVNDAANNGSVYVVDPQTAVATVVGTASQVAFVDGSGTPVDFPAAASGYGFDFNPTVDRIRVVTDSGLNFRLNPVTGAAVDGNLNNTAAPPAGTNTDGPINALPAGATGVSAAAYTNSFGQSLTGGVTTQFVIDAASNTLFIQNPPNAGTLTAPMAITLGGAALDFTTASGFDIPSNVRVTASASAPPTGSTGFAALTVGGASRLYSIDLLTGAATDLGALAANISGLAAGQTAVR